MTLKVARFSVLGVCCGLAACNGSVGDSRTVVRDSAGITIVEHSSGSAPAPWRLSASPLITLGGSSHTDDLQLFRIRGARWLGTAIAIANAGSSEILVVDSSGAIVASMGGEGEGPGEFRGLSDIQIVQPDSILAYDVRLRRFQLFDRAGRLARTFTLEKTGGDASSPLPLGVLPSRLLVVRGLRRGGSDDPETSGVVRDTMDIVRYDLEGRFVDTVATVPAWEAYNGHSLDGRIGILNTPIPFGHRTFLAVGAGRIIIGSTDRNALRIFGKDGRLQRVIRQVGTPGAAVTPDEIVELTKRAVNRAPAGMRSDLAAIYEEMPVPDRRPPIRGLGVADDGAFWVSGWPGELGGAIPVRVFSGDGDLIASIELPSELSITDISADRIMGIWTDSLGVEQVRIYPIERPEQAAQGRQPTTRSLLAALDG